MGLDLGEGSCALASAIPHNLGHCQPNIVDEDALVHSAHEGGNVPVWGGPGGILIMGFDKAAFAVEQVKEELLGLLLHAADDHSGFARVALRVKQLHEYLACKTARLPEVVLARCVFDGETELVPEPPEHLLGGMRCYLRWPRSSSRIQWKTPVSSPSFRIGGEVCRRGTE